MEEKTILNKKFSENFQNKKLFTNYLISSKLNNNGEFQINDEIINYDESHIISKSLMDFVIL